MGMSTGTGGWQQAQNGPRELAQLGAPGTPGGALDYSIAPKDKLVESEDGYGGGDAYSSYGIAPDQLDQLNEV